MAQHQKPTGIEQPHRADAGQANSVGQDSVSNIRLKGHVPALDGVRGLAIIMVLAIHFIGNVTPRGKLEGIICHIATYGALGVDLFFVLSGFLITGILFDSRKKPAYFRNFYMRRVLRIFPLYYAVLLFGLVIVPLFVSQPDLNAAVRLQGWLWSYSANIYLGIAGEWHALPIFSHFWSLAVEEHFYFVWPLVVFLCDGPRLKRSAILVACGALVLRVVMVACNVNDVAVSALTPGRLDALSMGGLMAVIAREEGGLARLTRLAPRTLGLGFAFIVISFLFTRIFPQWKLMFHEVRQTAFAVCFCAMIVFSLTGPRIIRRIFNSRFMMFFGKYSYGLYVFHFLYGYFLLTRRTADVIATWVGSHILATMLQAVLATGAAVIISLISYHGFEKHFLKLKTRF